MKAQGTITGRYLRLPVKSGAQKHWAQLRIRDEMVREFEIELAEGEPDFWAFIDVSAHLGRPFVVEVGSFPGLVSIVQSDVVGEAPCLYRERYRPRFHFSSRRGWLNDPDGLVYYAGEYHLFYQHNPFGVQWGNMHWGHAVSRDLVHWEELGEALTPDELGQMWSGSAVVDWRNTAGFQVGEEPPLVVIYTAAGGLTPASQGQPYTQCLASSTDGGRTWTKYAGNPVVGHLSGGNRDPKVIWHEPTCQWVMALFLDSPKGQPNYALLGSPDLKHWRRLCEVTLPCAECPDFFALPVDGDRANCKWVFWGADGHYLIGSFDGRAFTPEAGPLRAYAGDAYAAQTYSDAPGDGGRRQLAWLRGDLPEMPFNQQMTFPVEVTLRTTEEGIRLYLHPIAEIASLRARTACWRGLQLTPGERALEEVIGELLDVSAQLAVGDASRVGLVVRGVSVSYDVRTSELACCGHRLHLPLADRRLALRILADRASVEVFANDGRAYLPVAVVLDDTNRSLTAFAEGGSARLDELVVHELRSAWAAPPT